jgi:pimeloyl-ACP methyl ester carboxylesterase
LRAARLLIVGISLGGYVALQYAAAHPGHVAGLVLASTTINFTGVLGAYIRLVGWLLGRVFSESWQRERLIHSMRRKYPAEIAEPLITAGLYPRATGEASLALAGRDFRKPLASVQCPLLFLNGEDDAASRRGEQSFVSVASHAQVEYIAAAGHLSNLQQPTAFNAAVRRFTLDVVAAHPRASANSQRPAGRHA